MARTAFMGTPDFAVRSLAALAEGTELQVVVAQPDKARGRGQEVQSPPTILWARAHGIQTLQPERARDPGFLEALGALDLDLLVVAAYGKILPKALLELPKLGCVNVHASLLPKYRGAAPIQWAIARGESETGITLMQMDEGLDTGGMLAVSKLPIDPADTGETLTGKLAALGGELLGRTLPDILAGRVAAVPQDPALATLAPKLTREDAQLDFSLSASVLQNRIRAFQPWPSALAKLPSGALLKVLKTQVVEGSGVSGTVLAVDRSAFVVAAGEGALRVLEVQPEGKRRMASADFLSGHRLQPGDRLG